MHYKLQPESEKLIPTCYEEKKALPPSAVMLVVAQSATVPSF